MAPPTNDNFASAEGPLSTTLPASTTGTTFDSTVEGSEPSFFGSTEQSVWYYFTPSSTGWYKFWLDESEIVEHNGRGLGLALGSPTTLTGYTTSAVETRVEHNPNISFTGSLNVAYKLTASTTYRIRVYSTKGGSPTNTYTSDFTLRWDQVDVPSNDEFANAEDVGTLPATLTVDTYDSTMETGEPLINSGFYSAIQSIWYTFDVATPGIYRVKLLLDDIVCTGTEITGNIDGIDRFPGSLYLQVFKDFVDTLAEATEANALITNSIGPQSSRDLIYTGLFTTTGTYYIRISHPYLFKATASFDTTWTFNSQTASTTMVVEQGTPPANDDFANAEALSTTLPGTLTGLTTFDATQEATEPDVFSSGSNIEQSIWYTFTPPSTGYYRFRIPYDSVVYEGTQTAGSGELKMGIWDESVLTDITSANLIGYDDVYPESGGPDALITISLTSGTTYYIKIGSGFGTTPNRSVCGFDLEWEVYIPPPPATNNDFIDRIVLTGSNGTEDGSNIGADLETDEEELYAIGTGFLEYGGGKSVWYEWTAPDDAEYKFQTTGSGDDQIGDTILTVVTGTGPGDFVIVAQNDDDPDGGVYSEVTFTTVMGTTYYISVDGYQGYDPSDPSWDPTNADEGTFTIEWDYAEPPPPTPPVNDNFTSRIILPYHYAATIDGTTIGATTEVSEPNTNPGSINPPHPSVWYQYTPPNYENEPLDIIFDTEGSPTDTFLEVFTGSSIESLTPVASDHNSGAGGRSKLTINSNGDVNYKIRVSSPPGSEGSFSLHINIDPGGTPPANDDFANAELLTGYSDSASGTTVGATGEYGDKGYGFSGPTGESTNSVWYHYVPPQTGKIIITFTDADEEAFMSFWRGTTLDNLVNIEGIFGGDGDWITLQVEGGVDYYFKVEGNGGFESASFSFDLLMANVSPPANDEPNNAIVISAVNGTTNLTIPTEGALWDTEGPNIGDYITNADEASTVWWKFTTGNQAGTIYLTFNDETLVVGEPTLFSGLLYLYEGTSIGSLELSASSIGQVGHPFVSSSVEVALKKNTTYWLKLESYYWQTAVDIDMTLQFQDVNDGGVGPDPVNGTGDFDSTTGGFVADDEDGEFVASGAVGYGTLEPWTDGSHYPYGWWCRFDLNSTSGDYLYRYGQTTQAIEFFRATKTGGDYHSLYLVGSRDGTQTIQAGINGSISYGTGYRVFGLSKFGTSEKVRIEVGENGITIDGRCFRHSDFDFPIFKDEQSDQFEQFDFGIINYPGDGSAYVDLDPEWNLRFSNIRIHDNPDENVMGTHVPGVKEVSSIAGWTQGFDYSKPNSYSFGQISGSTTPGGGHIAEVVPSEGEYDGYSLDCTVISTSNVNGKGYRWANSNIQPGTNIYYNPYVDPANDSYFPGFSFRFWIDTMPSEDLVIAFIASSVAGFDSGDNGCFLVLETDGTLSIMPSKQSTPIPFCNTEVGKWNYIELQADVSTRKYATKIWLDNVYMGRFETNASASSIRTTIPNRPPMWGSYAVGRLSAADSLGSSFTFSDVTVGIQFRDIATTRRKVDRPLGPTIVAPMAIESDGTHNYPDPDTFEPNVPDEGFNSDFSGGTDGAGQPHYWTGYDRHDSSPFAPPSGAMYLGYLFRTTPNGLVSLTTDGSGPPGHESENAMRVEMPTTEDANNPGTGATYVFGGATEPAVDLVYNLNYADSLCAQFWVKGVAGKTVNIFSNTGIGNWDGFNSHTLDGTWEHVKLWLQPNSVVSTVQLQSVVVNFPDADIGDVFLIKDFHLYLNPENNPPHFWESSDGGATGEIVPFDATDTWEYIADMPPDSEATQIYTNTRNLLNHVRGQEDDGKTHLPPLWSDHYLEWEFGDYSTDNNQVFAAKIIVSLKGYNGQANTNDNDPDLDGYVQGGYSIFTIANSDGAIRYIGKHAAHIHINDDDQTFYGIQLTRPPGNGEWNLSAWNDTQLRFMSHDKTFENSLLILGDFQGAGLIEGAVAEILTFDRKLPPPACVRPIDLSRIRFRAYEEPAVEEEV